MSEWKPIDRLFQLAVNGKKVDLWVKWWDPVKDIFVGKRIPDCYQVNNQGDFRWCAPGNVSGLETTVKVTHFMEIPGPPERFNK